VSARRAARRSSTRRCPWRSGSPGSSWVSRSLPPPLSQFPNSAVRPPDRPESLPIRQAAVGDSAPPGCVSLVCSVRQSGRPDGCFVRVSSIHAGAVRLVPAGFWPSPIWSANSPTPILRPRSARRGGQGEFREFVSAQYCIASSVAGVPADLCVVPSSG
jgi:hypothetical protein